MRHATDSVFNAQSRENKFEIFCSIYIHGNNCDLQHDDHHNDCVIGYVHAVSSDIIEVHFLHHSRLRSFSKYYYPATMDENLLKHGFFWKIDSDFLDLIPTRNI